MRNEAIGQVLSRASVPPNTFTETLYSRERWPWGDGFDGQRSPEEKP
jgi:hypothetical protein